MPDQDVIRVGCTCTDLAKQLFSRFYYAQFASSTPGNYETLKDVPWHRSVRNWGSQHLWECLENAPIEILERASLLHRAAKSKNLKLVKFLVETKKMHVNARGIGNRTPLFTALIGGSHDVIYWLFDHGANLLVSPINENPDQIEGLPLPGPLSWIVHAARRYPIQVLQHVIEEARKDETTGNTLFYMIIQKKYRL